MQEELPLSTPEARGVWEYTGAAPNEIICIPAQLSHEQTNEVSSTWRHWRNKACWISRLPEREELCRRHTGIQFALWLRQMF